MQGYGEFIKKHRLLSGFTSQRKFANATGINHATIARIEKEEQLPVTMTLKTLSQHLYTTSLNELLKVCGYEGDKIELVKINMTNDKFIETYDLSIDDKSLSKKEIEMVIQIIRLSRDK